MHAFNVIWGQTVQSYSLITKRSLQQSKQRKQETLHMIQAQYFCSMYHPQSLSAARCPTLCGAWLMEVEKQTAPVCID